MQRGKMNQLFCFSAFSPLRALFDMVSFFIPILFSFLILFFFCCCWCCCFLFFHLCLSSLVSSSLSRSAFAFCVAPFFSFIFVSMWKTCSAIIHGAWINYNVAKVIINILKCACARVVAQFFSAAISCNHYGV